MNDQSAFEARLARTFAAYADMAPVEVDAVALATCVIGGRRGALQALRARPFMPNGWMMPVLLGLLLLALTAGAMLVAANLIPRPRPAPPTSWELAPTGALVQERSGHTATRLADGRVLVVGGRNGWNGGAATAAELFDPLTGTFAVDGGPLVARANHTATLLADGRVLIAGGTENSGNPLALAEIYDPATGTFTAAGEMSSRRVGHDAVLIPDGRVALIGGGLDLGGGAPASIPVELYDPTTGSFTALSMRAGLNRVMSVVLTLADGRVLVTGAGRSDTVLLDPATGETVTAVRPPVRNIRGSVTLEDGRIVLAADNGVALFDPDAGTYTVLGDLPRRAVLPPALLADGRVLVTMLDADCTRMLAVALDPGDGSTDEIGAVAGIGGCNGIPRTSVTGLANGDVLLAGGNTSGGVTTNAASLVRAGRPTD
jgi:hypothetical protein